MAALLAGWPLAFRRFAVGGQVANGVFRCSWCWDPRADKPSARFRYPSIHLAGSGDSVAGGAEAG